MCTAQNATAATDDATPGAVDNYFTSENTDDHVRPSV